MNNLFGATTIPVLEQLMSFSQARHEVLAGNIANIDTPGYVARDLSVADFQQRLQQAIEVRQEGGASPGAAGLESQAWSSVEDARSILFHDQSQVGVEQQVTEMVKNRMQHNLALSILVSQFRLLQAAVSERA